MSATHRPSKPCDGSPLALPTRHTPPRVWSNLLSAALVCGCWLGCSHRPALLAPGHSDAPFHGALVDTPEASSSTTAPKPWPQYAKVLALPRLRAPFETFSHGATRAHGSIRGNRLAEQRWRQGPGAGAYPQGALFVFERLEGRDMHRSEVFVMEKRKPGYAPDSGDWAYRVLTPDGKTVAEGNLEACARCHAEAPDDHVFLR